MFIITKTNILITYLLLLSLYTKSTSSTSDSFIYGGCSNTKYTPNSPSESAVNSALISLVNSATTSTYNNFTTQTTSTLFQCRGDLTIADCASCISRAVSQLGSLCPESTGGVIQLDGCFIKYDNSSFIGVEDKSEVYKKCGPLISYDSTTWSNRDAVLGYLGSGDGTYKPYRVTVLERVYGVAQCTGDLSGSECQDCLTEAIGRLKTECGGATWGDIYLGKCYARFAERGSHSPSPNGTNDNDEEIEKTLAILIGLIAGVALLVVFLSCLSKCCENGGKGGK
ncbi:hypothetical protein ACFE04_018239 [Oxalis oulophora]